MKLIIWTDDWSKTRNQIAINCSDIDTSDFEKNPVLIHQHDSWTLPIGTVKNIAVNNGIMTGEIVWDEKDSKALEIKGKYERGIMKAFSPRFNGYNPTELQVGDKRYTKFEKAKLIEISTVVIPNHSDTLLLNAIGESKDVYDVRNEFEMLIINSEDNMKQILNHFGLPETATEVDVMSKITELKNNLDATTQLAEGRKNKVEQLENELKTVKETAQNEKVATLINSAISAKKITKEQGDTYTEIAKMDGGYEKVEKILNSLQGAKSITEQLQEKAGEHTQLLNSLENDRKGWDYIRWMKDDPKGLEVLKNSYPDKYKKLLDEEG